MKRRKTSAVSNSKRSFKSRTKAKRREIDRLVFSQVEVLFSSFFLPPIERKNNKFSKYIWAVSYARARGSCQERMRWMAFNFLRGTCSRMFHNEEKKKQFNPSLCCVAFPSPFHHLQRFPLNIQSTSSIPPITFELLSSFDHRWSNDYLIK